MQTTAAITRLSADLARLAEVEARLLTHAQSLDVHGAAGMNSLAAWLAHTTRMTRGQANAKVRLAEALAAHDQTRAAVQPATCWSSRPKRSPRPSTTWAATTRPCVTRLRRT